MKHQDDAAIRIYPTSRIHHTGTGPGSAGQSGDTQGLSDVAEVTSESVKELVEEGQFFEAEIVSGIEDAADPGEAHTREVPEDDVPLKTHRTNQPRPTNTNAP